MSGEKPLVLVVGAAGFTGSSVVDGLLQSGNFRVAALIRPSSAKKPTTEGLRAKGVEIRLGDITDSHESLKQILAGVNTLIISVVTWLLDAQRGIIRAAHEVGVQRVIPCDFASAGERGIRAMHDKKLGIHDYIKELGVGYTFIEVGWWMQLFLPLPLRNKASDGSKHMSWYIYGSGKDRNLVTDINHIGTYVARIIADPRTLNQSVQIWEDEVSQLEEHELGERISGDGDALKAKRTPVTKEQLLQWADEAKEVVTKDHTNAQAAMKLAMAQYMYHCHILEENTLANVKRLGFLDARELYPDIPKYALEDGAKAFYALEDPGIYYSGREPEIRLP